MYNYPHWLMRRFGFLLWWPSNGYRISALVLEMYSLKFIDSRLTHSQDKNCIRPWWPQHSRKLCKYKNIKLSSTTMVFTEFVCCWFDGLTMCLIVGACENWCLRWWCSAVFIKRGLGIRSWTFYLKCPCLFGRFPLFYCFSSEISLFSG